MASVYRVMLDWDQGHWFPKMKYKEGARPDIATINLLSVPQSILQSIDVGSGHTLHVFESFVVEK